MVALAPLRRPEQMRGFVNTTIWLLIILQVVAMLIWRQGQDRFHVVRESGRSYDKTGWREFFGYVFALVLLMSSLPIFLSGIQMRIRGMDVGAYSAELLLLRTNHQLTNSASQNETKTGNDVLEDVTTAFRSQPTSTLLNISNYGIYSFNYSGSREMAFLEEMQGSAAIAQLSQVTEEQLIERLSHYNGVEPADFVGVLHRSVNFYDSTADNYREASRAAYQNARTFFQLGFDTGQRFILISWLVTFALAIHFSMVRLLYKYNSKRAVILLTAAFLGVFFFYWFGGIFFGLLFFDWMGDVSASIPALGFIALTAFCFLRSVRIMSLERYSRWHALQLAFLPMLLGLLPFAGLLLLESMTGFRFMDRHFFDSTPYNTWSIYPHAGWLLYTLQFAYVPFIPMLKQRFVRLESLPRG